MTRSFDEDPATYRVMERNGNVKMGPLRRVQGRAGHRREAQRQSQADRPGGRDERGRSRRRRGEEIRKLSREVQAEDQPDRSRAIDRVAPGSMGALSRMTTDNVATDEYPVKPNGVTTIGRVGCDINLPDDTMLSSTMPRSRTDHRVCFLRDDGSETGVFLRSQARWIDLELPALVRAGRTVS